MHTLTFQCDVPPARTILVHLPDSIQPGMHDVVVIIDEDNASAASIQKPDRLMRFSGATPNFSTVDAVAFQTVLREEWQ